MQYRYLAFVIISGAVTIGSGAYFHTDNASAQAGKKEPAVKKSDAVEKIIAPHEQLRTDWPIVRIHLDHIAEDERRITIDDPANILLPQLAESL